MTSYVLSSFNVFWSQKCFWLSNQFKPVLLTRSVIAVAVDQKIFWARISREKKVNDVFEDDPETTEVNFLSQNNCRERSDKDGSSQKRPLRESEAIKKTPSGPDNEDGEIKKNGKIVESLN